MRKYWPFLFGLILTLMLFWPFFFQGKIPGALDMLTGYYLPWRDIHFSQQLFPFPVKNLESFDAVRQNYPWKYLAISQYKNFQLPLWNPTHLSGVPLAAEFISGSLYALNAIYFITSFNFGWGLTSILQTSIAFVSLYFFCRSLGRSKLSSTFAATAFAFSGFIAGFFYTNLVGHAVAWIPLSLTGLSLYFKTGSKRWLSLTVIGYFLIGTAAHLQILFYSFALGILFALFFALNKKTRLISILAVCLGIVSTAYQLLPSIELISFGNRIRNFDGSSETILSTWFQPLLSLAPNYFGNPGKQNYFGAISYYHEFSFYTGLITVLFALLTLKRNTSKQIFFWWSIIVITLILVTDNFISRLPSRLNIPVLGSMTPTRIYSLFTISISILAAYGIDLWQKSKHLSKQVLISGLLIFCGLILLAVNALTKGSIFWKFLFDTTPANVQVSIRNLFIPFAIFGTGFPLLIWGGSKNRRLKTLVVSFLMLVTAVDLLRQFSTQFSFISSQAVFPSTQITSYLSKQFPPPRILPLEDIITPTDSGAVYGWEDIDGYQANNIRSYLDTLSRINSSTGLPNRNFQKMASLTDPYSPAINRLGVEYVLATYELGLPYLKIITENKVSLYKNSETIQRFRTSGPALININEYSPNTIELNYKSNSANLLYTFIPVYPGWTAKINDIPIQILNDQNGFISLNIPEGEYVLTLKYLPVSIVVGLMVSVLSIIACSIPTYSTRRSQSKFNRAGVG